MLSSLALSLVLAQWQQLGLLVKDEGTVKGYATQVNCVGPLTCTSNGTVWTLTATVGGAPTDAPYVLMAPSASLPSAVVVPTCGAGESLTSNGSALSCAAGGSGAPTDATYLTMSANASLSAEVVVPTCTGTDKLTSNGTAISCATDQTGTTNPAGSNTQVQFNDSSSFGGDARFTFDKTTGNFVLGGTTYFYQPYLKVTETTGTGLYLYGGGNGGSVQVSSNMGNSGAIAALDVDLLGGQISPQIVQFKKGGVRKSFIANGGEFTYDGASGTNGLKLTLDGARLDLGTGTNDYLYSDGTGIVTPGQIKASELRLTGTYAIAFPNYFTGPSIINLDHGSGANYLSATYLTNTVALVSGGKLSLSGAGGIDLNHVTASTVAASTDAIKFNNNGARLDLGTGTTDYLFSDGTNGVESPGQIRASRFRSNAAMGNAVVASYGHSIAFYDAVAGTTASFITPTGANNETLSITANNTYGGTITIGSNTSLGTNTITSSAATGFIGNASTATALATTASTTWDPPSMTAGEYTQTTMTLTGAALGNGVVVSLSVAVPDGVMLTGTVSAADTVKVALWNFTGAPVDVASSTLKARLVP